uniref:hypothetical protein n=1 Tax=Acetatifactor sp. TaxID=1872090 RepID=UPI004056CC40
MKKKIVLMSVAAVLAMTAIVGGTLAGFNTQSEQGRTDITTKALGIGLEEGSAQIADSYLPGEPVEMQYYVTNNVAEGYDLYTRVTIYKYWENTELQADIINLYANDATGNKVELSVDSESGETVRINDWFVQYADEEQIILYYAKPLAAGEATGNVMDFLVIDEKAGNAYADQNVIIEIEADAVQMIAAESSIPSEWGVYPEFDENGNIVSIAE